MTLSTEDRAAINRRNSLSSTGPTSQRGKQNSSRNALKHGLTATMLMPIAIPGEAEGAFQEFVDSWIRDMAPEGALEIALIEDAARARWMGKRVICFQDAIICRRFAELTGIDIHAPNPQKVGEAESLGSKLMHRLVMEEQKHKVWNEKKNEYDYHVDMTKLEPTTCETSEFDNVGEIVFKLRSFREGVEWLLGCWTEIIPELPDPAHPVAEELVDTQLRCQNRAYRLLGIPTGYPPPKGDLLKIAATQVERLENQLASHLARLQVRMDAALCLFTETMDSKLIMRYERTANLQFHKAIAAFQKLRKGDDLGSAMLARIEADLDRMEEDTSSVPTYAPRRSGPSRAHSRVFSDAPNEANPEDDGEAQTGVAGGIEGGSAGRKRRR